MKERRVLVAKQDRSISKRRRAALLAVNLSTLYVKRKPVSADEITLMNEIQDIYAIHPFKGYRRICHDLQDKGYPVNYKRVLRLMRVMGLQAVYPKKNLSKRRQEDAVYPYLLRDFPPQKPHDCWSVDITYLKISTGFVYLTALIDVFSRHIMGWHLSPYLDTDSCLKALEMALKSGKIPEVINSDQGCQFTSKDWINRLIAGGIKISMDGKGRCLDNIFIERFWRSLKYEEVYLKTYESVSEARREIGKYIEWYNTQRRHQGLGYITPLQAMNGNKILSKSRRARPDGSVDNSNELPTSSTGPTTTTTALFKQQNDRCNTDDLSLQNAA
jgi:putative transposase